MYSKIVSQNYNKNIISDGHKQIQSNVVSFAVEKNHKLPPNTKIR